MATPFNVEEFRQQMSGQAPQGQPMVPPQQGQVPMMQPPPVPTQYAPQMQAPQMPQTQTSGPQAYPSSPPAMAQAAPQHYAPQQMQHPQPAYQSMPAPAMPQQPPQMAQPWAGQQQPGPQAYQPHPGHPPQHRPQTVPMMPPAQMFTPPPSQIAEIKDPAPSKPSRFKLKRTRKEKPAKEPKVKAVKEPKVKVSKEAKGEVTHKTKTSPPIIFMFGMATGILCFLVGSTAMSGLLTDKSAQSFREIERKNAMAQQPVLPGQQDSTKTAELTRGE